MSRRFTPQQIRQALLDVGFTAEHCFEQMEGKGMPEFAGWETLYVLLSEEPTASTGGWNLLTLIEHTSLSSRVKNALAREKIVNVGQLTNLTEDNLLCMRNLGVGCVKEIKTRLAEHGLSLQDPIRF